MKAAKPSNGRALAPLPWILAAGLIATIGLSGCSSETDGIDAFIEHHQKNDAVLTRDYAEARRMMGRPHPAEVADAFTDRCIAESVQHWNDDTWGGYPGLSVICEPEGTSPAVEQYVRLGTMTREAEDLIEPGVELAYVGEPLGVVYIYPPGSRVAMLGFTARSSRALICPSEEDQCTLFDGTEPDD
ncbi:MULTISPECIES: hypothetical protein [unclassified Thioalkalivibrio]|uniref:hypothetical protein n=1 Tax=unclassified Thioalkalivibrio TaxID=2621013 RepID=UPI00035D4BFE|nr:MULTISPECIES: hypothetical protein [unclassified Thioalkalivibrio]